MAEGDAWEKILQLARRIDEAVASRRGVDAEEALQLARAVVAFQQRIVSGSVLTPVPGPSSPPEAPPEVTGSPESSGES